MSVPAAIRDLLPVSFVAPLDKAFRVADEFATKTQSVYRNVRVQVVTGLKDVLPNEMHSVAEKITQKVPETLASLSMITGTLKIAATLYGVARLLWVATPIIQAAFRGDISGEPMDTALSLAKSRLHELTEDFKPAIFTACGISAVATAILGVVTLSPSLAMTGGFLGLLSYTALESMREVKPEAKSDEAKKAAEPTVQPQKQQEVTTTTTVPEPTID